MGTLMVFLGLLGLALLWTYCVVVLKILGLILLVALAAGMLYGASLGGDY